MKNKIFIFFASLALMMCQFQTSSAAHSLEDNLVDVTESTLINDYSTTQSHAFKIIYNTKQIINANLNANSIYANKSREMHSDLNVKFDTSPIFESDQYMPIFNGIFKIGEDQYFNYSEQTVYSQMRDADLYFLDKTEKRYADIGIGYFELFKFFTNQYIKLNIEEFKTELDSIGLMNSDLPPNFGSLVANIYNNNELAADLIRAILYSGLFDLSKNNNTYVIVVNNNPNNVNLEYLIEFAGNLAGIPEDMIKAAKEEAKNSTEEIIENWIEITKFFDLSIRVNTSSSKVIGFLVDFDLNYEEYGDNLNIVLKSSVTVDPFKLQRISFPDFRNSVIDLSKLFKAVKTLIEIEEEKYREWNEYEYDYENEWELETLKNSIRFI